MRTVELDRCILYKPVSLSSWAVRLPWWYCSFSQGTRWWRSVRRSSTGLHDRPFPERTEWQEKLLAYRTILEFGGNILIIFWLPTPKLFNCPKTVYRTQVSQRGKRTPLLFKAVSLAHSHDATNFSNWETTQLAGRLQQNDCRLRIWQNRSAGLG